MGNVFKASNNNLATLLPNELIAMVAEYLIIDAKDQLDIVLHLDPTRRVMRNILSRQVGHTIAVNDLAKYLNIFTLPYNLETYKITMDLKLWGLMGTIYPTIWKLYQDEKCKPRMSEDKLVEVYQTCEQPEIDEYKIIHSNIANRYLDLYNSVTDNNIKKLFKYAARSGNTKLVQLIKCNTKILKY